VTSYRITGIKIGPYVAVPKYYGFTAATTYGTNVTAWVNFFISTNDIRTRRVPKFYVLEITYFRCV
jgi:hypothetical protein